MKNLLFVLVVSLTFYNETQAAVVRLWHNTTQADVYIFFFFMILFTVIRIVISKVKDKMESNEIDDRIKKAYLWQNHNLDRLREIWKLDIPMKGKKDTEIEKDIILFWINTKTIYFYNSYGVLSLIRIIFKNWRENKWKVISNFDTQLKWWIKSGDIWYSPEHREYKLCTKVEICDNRKFKDLYWLKDLIINVCLLF
jgi:hypothetical protein